MKLMLEQLQAKEQEQKNCYKISLSNGEEIEIVRRPVFKGITWAWKIAGQYFYDEAFAREYLQKYVAERLTGKRILMRARGKAPEICIANEKMCWYPECNIALCHDCPIQDDMEAEKDGVALIYAVE